MTAFTLDTSGSIVLPYPNLHPHPRGVIWPDLSPFAQGYVEAAFASLGPYDWKDEHGGAWPSKFSDLAPATLAAMLKDCEHYERLKSIKVHPGGGGAFWRGRQNGTWPKNFPPLTFYLGDDGLIYAMAAS